MFHLRLPEREIQQWATRYSYPDDGEIEKRVAPAARKHGYLTRSDFLKICRWKTPRSAPLCAMNDDRFVREVTTVSLRSRNEQFKIEVLLLLRGVGWPTASVILHWCDQGQYPILDYRALWSLGAEVPSQYDFAFWTDYCSFMRDVAARTGLSMRVIDRALWQYSKERQGRQTRVRPQPGEDAARSKRG